MSRDIEPISLAIEVPVPPDVAWAYLTEPARVAEWLTEASPLGDVGAAYRLDFGEGSVVEGTVLELVPGRVFAHGWGWTDAQPRQDTRVRWAVEPVGSAATRITLLHDGWGEAGVDEALRDDHEAYWSGYLDDLRDLLDEPGRA
jgi:uncharacterized protein YndB with AHSA1/START domain